MERTYVNETEIGKETLLNGWVYEIRELAKLKFIILRDLSGLIQCVVNDAKLFSKVSELSLESVVQIRGVVKGANVKAENALSDREILVSEIELISKAETLPILVNEKSVTTEMSNRLDYRFLDFHKPKIAAIFKIQNTIQNSFREFFYNKGFIEMQPPCVIGAASEGGTDLFEVKYFEKKAYLAQSPQLYKQMVACSMEKTFMVTPVWRAEKHNTIRHINEIRQMDIEVAFTNTQEIMKYEEEVLKHIISRVIEINQTELDLLGVKLKVPHVHYTTYDEVIEMMNKHGISIKKGDDFTPEVEKKLGELYLDTLVFVYDWPTDCRAFYIMPKEEKVDSNYTEGFDCIYRGLEITSGGQRIHLPELLIGRVKKKGLNPDSFKDYINSFRYGAPPHSGWSIGLERLTMLICGLENIREATMFPRDRDRLTP